MHNIWAKRFNHYVREVQKYTQYIFTGHIGIVLVFVIGALGYQYSEWLKVVESDFPAGWIIAGIVGVIMAFSRPTTLLREPDQVYLLPLESKMDVYFKKALTWTYVSQMLLPIVLYIVSIPLLREVTNLTIGQIWIGVLFVIFIKLFNVIIEFIYRYANRGQALIVDRVARMAINVLVLEAYLNGTLIDGLIFMFLLVAYYVILRKKLYVNPIPYEHFVKVEQNRMLRFYRFANLFTDVPHLRGAVKRRKWLDFTMGLIAHKKGNAQAYLVARTFIRTNDLFFLWVRLTALAALFAAFITIPFVTWIIVAALSFALVIQLKQALNSNAEFRMDMLFPGENDERKQAVNNLLLKLVVLKAAVVLVCSMFMPMFFVAPLIIIVSGLVTIRFTS